MERPTGVGGGTQVLTKRFSCEILSIGVGGGGKFSLRTLTRRLQEHPNTQIVGLISVARLHGGMILA